MPAQQRRAGYCAVVTAEHEGTSYLAIAMGAGYDDEDIYSFCYDTFNA